MDHEAHMWLENHCNLVTQNIRDKMISVRSQRGLQTQASNHPVDVNPSAQTGHQDLGGHEYSSDMDTDLDQGIMFHTHSSPYNLEASNHSSADSSDTKSDSSNSSETVGSASLDEDSETDDMDVNFPQIQTEAFNMTRNVAPWFPVGREENVAGLTALGSTLTQTSRKSYDGYKLAARVMHTDLPCWNAMSSLRKELRSMLGLDVKEFVSPLGNTCYTLVIEEQLRLYFTHCGKWVHGLRREFRAPMVKTTAGIFYIYEPARLKDGRLVVPSHFWQLDGVLHAKILTAEIFKLDDSTYRVLIPEEPDFGFQDSINCDELLLPFPKCFEL
ncbi:uncharacterized protein MELLADRAFT_103254 [Melampsora larici-populina 98AG31]|uniref:Uncharacterized protein n=1 Tax=Melampsora larici-populina (strain 98AG31 / pathotype 3-4-7) TaxID=747676 RepID=F4R9S7_MELLP|nr:uncharacterized protein MELLADRAFT_103254 [Melampsora larici-populina 98AG31]EGG10573.1 hypothetical protein MELLADRAFT_103254 [Melampsora larici-populina 98AG31]